MKSIALKLNDTVYAIGLLFLFVSLVVFLVPVFSPATNATMGLFSINFLLSAGYFIVLLVSGRLKRSRNGLHVFILFLVLFLTSAYALNREMNVFQDSANWFCFLLVITGINYIAFAFFDSVPRLLKHVMFGILGVALVVFIYLSIYLLPLYPVGAVAFPALGISLHTFVPLLFSIYSIVLLRKTIAVFPKGIYSFLAGILIVLLVVMFFIFRWNSIVHTINKEYRKELIAGDAVLPAWVRISQKLNAGPITERILKTGLVYGTPSFSGDFFQLPGRNFGEQQKHDPLVMLSSMTTERVHLSEEEKVNILKSLYDSRHQAEERLWSGDHLRTDHINTMVELWPSIRMAYTEKIITVTNESRDNWRSSEEAIYTFHMPEGSVVTSLSLWINGKEEKALLTSKEKAATAYKTIVGYERRDPSVVQWQEGNRVSVRVFPVLAGESRMFKIGVTSPLQKKATDLVYDNIYFDGPSIADAEEDVKIHAGNGEGIITPSSFEKAANNSYTKDGDYDAAWSVSCTASDIAANAFVFDGNEYSVRNYQPDRQPAMLETVFLDINNEWTADEFGKVWELVKGKQVFVFNEGVRQQMSDKNASELFDQLHQLRFSLFPFYRIKDAANSVVITSCGTVSPNMEELAGSDFMFSINIKFDPNERYKLFNLGQQLTPYLRSLQEKRYFNYEAGTVQDLQRLFQSNTFAVQAENEQEVIVHEAGVKLVKTPATQTTSSAPDHLMRLFTYNHIMQQLGTADAFDTSRQQALVEAAQQSYIVTPLSSLVVLESKDDYERFDIKETDNSLKNASMKSTGAVPEPHEWALIILTILVLLYVKFPMLFKRVLWKA
jgi:XrtN system VIT domain protein